MKKEEEELVIESLTRKFEKRKEKAFFECIGGVSGVVFFLSVLISYSFLLVEEKGIVGLPSLFIFLGITVGFFQMRYFAKRYFEEKGESERWIEAIKKENQED